MQRAAPGLAERVARRGLPILRRERRRAVHRGAHGGPAAAPRPQRSYNPSKSKRDSPFTASDASLYFFVPVLVLGVAGFASSAASAAKAAADTSFALLTLGAVGALLLLYVGAQDDVDAEPKRRTTEEEDAENEKKAK